MDYNELYERYISLQGIAPTRMTIEERIELQEVLKGLMECEQVTEYDIEKWYKPRYDKYEWEVNQIMDHLRMEYIDELCKIFDAKRKLEAIKNKLDDGMRAKANIEWLADGITSCGKYYSQDDIDAMLEEI
jgi:hypothetical protein